MQPVTLVTGASAGLGAEFARQCAARGDSLVLVARRRDRLDALRAQLGGDVQVYEGDLSKSDAVDGLLTWLAGSGLQVRILVNNAGFGLAGRFDRLDGGRQLEMIDLNVRTLTALCRAFLPRMIEEGKGGILNVASTAAFQAGPHMAVYYATKAFVLSLTEALHQEAKGTGVHVTALCPGPVATEFFEVAGAANSRLARMCADAPSVVRAGLKGLERNRAIVVPGVANRFGAQAHRFLPRSAMRRIIASIKL